MFLNPEDKCPNSRWIDVFTSCSFSYLKREVMFIGSRPGLKASPKINIQQVTKEMQKAMEFFIIIIIHMCIHYLGHFSPVPPRPLPRCPTTDEWIKKMWYLYTMEFYAAMKKNEMLSFAGKWMELENIILSEVSLAQKTKNCMFSLICGH
jgi:hypothetical protein